MINWMLFFYPVHGIAAGYVAVRMSRTLKGGDHRDWKSVSLHVACFFPGIAFLILTVLNFLLLESQSTAVIPISLFVILLALWFCLSVPLTLLGGYFGAKALRLNTLYAPIKLQERFHRKNITLGSWLFVQEHFLLGLFSLSSSSLCQAFDWDEYTMLLDFSLLC